MIAVSGRCYSLPSSILSFFVHTNSHSYEQVSTGVCECELKLFDIHLMMLLSQAKVKAKSRTSSSANITSNHSLKCQVSVSGSAPIIFLSTWKNRPGGERRWVIFEKKVSNWFDWLQRASFLRVLCVCEVKMHSHSPFSWIAQIFMYLDLVEKLNYKPGCLLPSATAAQLPFQCHNCQH